MTKTYKTKALAGSLITLLLLSALVISLLAMPAPAFAGNDEIVWEYQSYWFKFYGTPYEADRLPNGNTLICDSGGGEEVDNRIIEVDSNLNIVWKYHVSFSCRPPSDADRLPNGNTLICDGGGNRVIEVDPGGNIVWQYTGFTEPEDAERLFNGHTVIAGGGWGNARIIEVDSAKNIVWEHTGFDYLQRVQRLANGNTLFAAGPAKRVIEVNQAKEIVWEYEVASWVRDAERLPDGNTLISYGDEVIEVAPDKSIIWEYTKTAGDIDRLPNGNTLMCTEYSVLEVSPDKNIVWEARTQYKPFYNDAERLSSGNTLIAQIRYTEGKGRALEVDAGGNVVWEYTGNDNGVYPAGIRRLPNGNTLIADSDNARIIEVNPSKEIVWQFSTGLDSYPSDAERLSNGNTLIADWNNCCLLEVNTSGNVVWEYTDDDKVVMPAGIRRLPNGNTLIADGKNARVIEIGTLAAGYTLTTAIDPAGSGTVELNPAGGTYPAGTTVTLTANPAAGYAFDHWSGDLSGSANPATITMDANKNVTAHFIEAAPQPDVNNDGKVNVLDMVLIVQKWGQTGSPGWIKEDVNQDGKIDVLDMILVGQK